MLIYRPIERLSIQVSMVAWDIENSVAVDTVCIEGKPCVYVVGE